jgi:threonine/homoserine/homoserine lactone efflux protein
VTSLLLFAGMTLAVCLAPGPNVMLVIGFALKQGFGPALRAIIGISLINVLYLALAAAGLVALVIASAPLFAVVRYCGAAYLIYLGYKLLRAGFAPQTVEASEVVLQTPPIEGARPMLQGVLTHLGNPKGVLYWSALLPQFLDSAYPLALQITALGTFAVIIDFAVMCAYAILFASTSRLLQGSRYFRWIEICAGAVFIVSGVLLGTERFDVKLSQ